MRAHVHAACQRCRESKIRCIDGPPCENCVRLSQETCEFVQSAPRRKSVIQETRPGHYACRPCRTKKALCNGGPPCENCVVDKEDVCAFGFESRRKEHLAKMRRSACLPCRLRKIRCTGTKPPCGMCTTRGVESTCEFTKSSKRNSKYTATHTSYRESNHAAESSWSADPDNEPIHKPEITFTPLDTRPVHRSESPGCRKSLFTISSVASPSELRKTPSLVVNDSDESDQASSLVGCTSYEELLSILPGRQMIESLIERYFASLSMLFCVIDAAKFEAQYETFCGNPSVVPQSWLSLLFAILALACRAEEEPKRSCLSDNLSMLYEKTAWNCLLANEPPLEPSLNSLKAIVLVLYGRTHRGLDVFSDLQLGYHTAISTKCHIDTRQCVVEPTVCEEYRSLLIGLKMLSLLNAQVHDYRNRDLTQDLLPPTDIYESTKRAHPSLSAEKSPTQMSFTILHLQLLKISDTMCVSAELGLTSEWTLAGLETELFRMDKHCSEIYSNFSGSDLQLISHEGSQGILHCYINYLVHLLFLPDLHRYLDGDVTPETRISQSKCINFAKASLRNFNLLAENMQFKSYAWYIRGLGSYYAERSAYTLIRCLAGLQEEEQDQEARSILNRTLGIFFKLSDRSIFSARGAFILEHQ